MAKSQIKWNRKAKSKDTHMTPSALASTSFSKYIGGIWVSLGLPVWETPGQATKVLCCQKIKNARGGAEAVAGRCCQVGCGRCLCYEFLNQNQFGKLLANALVVDCKAKARSKQKLRHNEKIHLYLSETRYQRPDTRARQKSVDFNCCWP